ncbi:MAG: hypothetical protein FVQ84_00970 [Planctomycetes bacterium]|nr:hypothetical protein [Planctomycetota bacterium]
MTGKAEAGLMGMFLNVSFEECEWQIQIRHTDNKSDNQFLDLNQEEVSPDQIREFVPNWENLVWQQAGLEHISKEVLIQDGDYKLHLIWLIETSVEPDMEKAVQEFKAFMKE